MNPFPSSADFGQALRRLGRERGFAATALLTLGLCLGANAAIFAVVDAVLLRSLPFQEPDRLAIVYNTYPGTGVDRGLASRANYYDRREGVEAFASTSIIQAGSSIVGEAGSPRRVPRDLVSREFFETLGRPLLLGEAFNEEHMRHENSSAAILTFGFWQSYFAGDPNVIGKTFQVNRLPVTVVGVMPEGFRYLSSKAEFYMPAASSPEDRQPDRRHTNDFAMVVRLADGVSFDQAQDEMDRFNEIQAASDPLAHMIEEVGFATKVAPLRADHVSSIKTTLLLLQAGVLCLLLIGAVNLVNLLLIRASGRTKENAVRQALGAGKRHIARQALAETIALSTGGGMLGALIGLAGIQIMGTLGADSMPLGSDIAVDGRVLLVVFAASLVVGLALAAPIVLYSVREKLASALHSESRTGTTSRAAQRLRHGFIVVQISLAFMLLAGAGLLALSLDRVTREDPGFRAEQVLTGRISLPWNIYTNDDARFAFAERLISRIKSIPGVASVGISTAMPFSGSTGNNATTVEGHEAAEGKSIRVHYFSGVAGDYWQAMGIPLVEGRLLENRDNLEENQVCLVDQLFVERYFPGESPLGRRLAKDVELTEANAFTIVGVVGTVKQSELSEEAPLGAVYLPYRRNAVPEFTLAARTAMPPGALGQSLREAVLELDPELPLDNVKPLQALIDDTLVARRSPALLAGVFSVVALTLAGIGIYGVLAYSVIQRRREIGVRLALGASPEQIKNQFLLLGGKLLTLGIILGLSGTWLLGKAMQSVLYEVSPMNVGLAATVVAVVCAVSLVACYLPARRAAKAHPMEALAAE